MHHNARLRIFCVALIMQVFAFPQLKAQEFSYSAELLGHTILHHSSSHFGGLSGVEISDNGTQMLAISDRGHWVRAKITRDASSAVQDVNVQSITPIRHGRQHRRGVSPDDSEGLALAKDGTLFISFEGQHRIGQFASPLAQEQTVPSLDTFSRLQNNSGLEALAIDQNGWLYTLPERSGHKDKPFPLYRYDGTSWHLAAHIQRMAGFLIVGADFGPDHAFYVLERNFTGLGFVSQVRRMDLEQQTSQVILNTQGQFGNLEGLSVWKNQTGETILSMVSDDNFHFFLNTSLVEYKMNLKVTQ